MPTRRRPTRVPTIQTKRWLWTHPSHLEWWYGRNLRKHPHLKTQITGIINVYAEHTHKVKGVPTDSEQHHNKWKDFAEEMGWDYIPGLRFTHTKVNKHPRRWLFDKKNHEAMVKKANKWGSIALDMEPYGITGFFKYHTQSEVFKLNEAAQPWKECKVPVAIYPSVFTAPEIILSNTPQKITLDHTTYNFKKLGNINQAITERHNYFSIAKLLSPFWTGLYLAYLNDKEFIKKISRVTTNLWFYPRVKDDRPNFLTPNWAPDK
jgi:hypothetical protein